MKLSAEAGHGTEKVVKNIAEADDAHKREIIKLAQKVGKNDGMIRAGARARIVRQADARSELAGHFGVQGEYDAELVVDKARYPKSAKHIGEAQQGRPWRGDSVR